MEIQENKEDFAITVPFPKGIWTFIPLFAGIFSTLTFTMPGILMLSNPSDTIGNKLGGCILIAIAAIPATTFGYVFTVMFFGKWMITKRQKELFITSGFGKIEYLMPQM